MCADKCVYVHAAVCMWKCKCVCKHYVICVCVVCVQWIASEVTPSGA